MADDDGSYCMVGQHGTTWFLADTFSGQPTTRTCNVPEGATLFFPVINSVNFNTPGCFQDNTDLSVSELRALVAPPIDGASGLSVLLDNRPIRSVRVQSDPFPVVVPGKRVLPAIQGQVLGAGADLLPVCG